MDGDDYEDFDDQSAKQRKQQQLIETIELQRLMSQRTFRRWVWRLLQSCGTSESVFSTDHATMSRKEGRRQVGCEIRDALWAADHSLYMLMVEEAERDEQHADA